MSTTPDPNRTTPDLTGRLKPEVLEMLKALDLEADRYMTKRHPEDSLTWRYLASIQGLLIRLHNKYDNSAANSNQSLLSAAAPEMKAALEFILANSGDPVMENAARAALAKAEGK